MSVSRDTLKVGAIYAVHPHHRFDSATVNFAHKARYKGLLFEEAGTKSVSPLVFEMIEPGSANVNAPKPGEEFRLANAGMVWMQWEKLQNRALQFAGGMTAEQARKELQDALAVLGVTRRVYMAIQERASPRTTQVGLLGREILEIAERFQTLKEIKNA